jgi:hypothetical protein
MSADPDDDENTVGDDAGEGAQNLIDGIAAGFFDIVDGLVDFVDAILFTPADALEIAASGGDLGGVLGQVLEESQPADEGAAAIVDTAEELVVAPLQQEGEITPDNVEALQDDLEGNASAVLLSIVLVTLGIEAFSDGRIDEVPAELFGVVTSLGFDDVTGREIDARLNEGIDPALKQKVHSEHRSKQADFQDFVTASLRTKAFDTDVSTRGGVGEDPLDGLLTDTDTSFLNDPDTYGTIPDQTSLYELDALTVSEPEEIIEEPIQYGVPVPKSAVKLLNELQGFPESTKSVFQQVIESLPRSETLIQDYVRLTEYNFRLREKVQAGVMTPEQARDEIKPELEAVINRGEISEFVDEEIDRTEQEVVDFVADELLANFQLLQSLPSDPPTAGDIQSFYRKGVINSQTFEDLYEQFGRGNGRVGQYLREQTIDKGAESIRRQATLGRISDTEATTQLERIGFSTSEANAILDGSNPDDIVSNRVQDRAQTDALPVELAVNIGDVRGQRLRLAGIETLQDLQNVDVTEVTAVTGVNDQIAQEAINSAGILLTEAATQESN